MLWAAYCTRRRVLRPSCSPHGHNTVALAVYAGHVDAGAGHDGVITDLAAKPGYADAAQRLTRIAWSDPIPSDPIVGHIPDDRLRPVGFRRRCCAWRHPTDPTTPGNVAASGFWGTAAGFERIDPDAYRPLLDLMDELALRPADAAP